MTFQVFLSEKAQQDLDAIPTKQAEQILVDCRRLADDPIPDGKRVKKLQGFKDALYRLRAGDYRVVFRRTGTRIDIVRVLSKGDFQRAY
ncbi:MAG: type II toxin-antitoxin system mRNA interferase toxin, RelE/StbE family [Nitrospiraceae bacterium]|nr:type II toxin-antitoxin system mRNA interferase toxin, RelE/StbE family [Nitrospiraceae bacterium]MSR24906.1 type II toxin-antitoxin system mRNA interferase toxin, RelE/StbE family [Nitrospiraceae bacterium]